MKVIVSDNIYEGTSFKRVEETAIYLKADSTLLKDGKPFFVPEELGVCYGSIAWGVRISRLGKGIGRKFAHRYYNQVTIGINFSIVRNSQGGESPLLNDLSRNFDGSTVVGTFLPVMEFLNDGRMILQVQVEHELKKWDLDRAIYSYVDELIEYVSRYNTLKQGDLFFIELPGGQFRAIVNQHLCGTIAGERILEFNIK